MSANAGLTAGGGRVRAATGTRSAAAEGVRAMDGCGRGDDWERGPRDRLAAFELLAITDYVRDNATPLISLAAAEDVTQRKANPFVIRPSATSAQCCHVIGDYAVKELKYKRAATISEDFAFGYEQMSGFQRVFEDGGGKVVKKLWPPLVTPDYAPYIAQIGNVDCVFNGFAGSNPVKFMRSYADLGVKYKVPLLAGWTAVDDALLKSLSDEAIGVVSASWYSAEADTPSNKRFVEAMHKVGLLHCLDETLITRRVGFG